jgi:SAM-dependent methyltransferase
VTEMRSLSKRESPLRQLVRRAAKISRRLIGLPRVPGLGSVRWGGLRRTRPIGGNFGYDRGKPIDRGYIEHFLSSWSNDIRGSVLEVKDSNYVRRFGGANVSHFDVLDIDAANPEATIITDLNSPAELAEKAFDCIILTQTLQYVFDLGSALRGLHRSLRPGGVLLMTVPGISRVCTRDQTWYWNFTDLSVERLLRDHFPSSDLQVATCGNLLSATAFLYGLSCDELRSGELAASDPEYPVIISARVRKAAE